VDWASNDSRAGPADEDTRLQGLTNLASDSRRDAESPEDDYASIDEALSARLPTLSASHRFELAKSVAASPVRLPQTARRLALREINVAWPIILSPTALDEDDLPLGHAQGTQEHLQAVAGRLSLSAAATDALVARGADSVLTSLVENPGMRLPRGVCEVLLHRALRNPALRAAYARRQDLPSDILQALCDRVGGAPEGPADARPEPAVAPAHAHERCPTTPHLEPLGLSADWRTPDQTESMPAHARQPQVQVRPVAAVAARGVEIFRSVRGRMPAVRRNRYVIVAAPVIAGIWLLAIAVILLTPARFTSHMTLILPGAGSGGSINLEKIGQATSASASPFAGTGLSPTESYKRLLGSDRTLEAAAALLRQPVATFSPPKIKLIDQTSLIEVDVTADSAVQARDRAVALRSAFLSTLEQLRRDEAAKRETADRMFILNLQAKARDAQARLLAFQAETGLVSVEQFNNRIGALDALRDRENVQRTLTRQSAATTARMAQTLGASTTTARQAMVLKGDPVFQALLARYAAIETQGTEKGATLGDGHVVMAELNAQDRGLRDALVARGRTLTGLSAKALLSFADISVADGRANLLEAMVSSDSNLVGAAAALADIRQQIKEQSSNSGERVEQASQLAELNRDLRVAEAVFSSALARLDMNKSDPFASYPLVQTIEEPTLPKGKSSPSPKMVLAGAVLATLMNLIGFGLLWLRKPTPRKP